MTTELTTRVLGIRRTDSFATVALEMDVWRYGESRSDALLNLQEHIEYAHEVFGACEESGVISPSHS